MLWQEKQKAAGETCPQPRLVQGMLTAYLPGGEELLAIRRLCTPIIKPHRNAFGFVVMCLCRSTRYPLRPRSPGRIQQPVRPFHESTKDA